MRLSFRLAVLFAVLPATISGWAADAPVRRRVLLLGQKADSHPATTHEYMSGVRLLGLLLERSPGIQTVIVQADSPWTDGPELLDGTDAAILFLSEGAKWVTEDVSRLAAFQRLAKRGGGLTCLHWGMGTREPAPIADFTALFGGCHGGQDRKYKFASFSVKPMETHPVTTGITPFEVRDEFYYALKQPAPALKLKVAPLLQISIDGTDQTVAWACERPDGGRSFGFSGLHYHENWKLPQYRRLVLQGVLWTLKHDIPEEGVPVEIRQEDLALPSR
jgi:type 1 glutamine amidotransferase